MTPRWVLHVDLDQFLASVELRRHPELAGLPVIVGGNGDPTEPRKVVTCASYEAREFGVHAGMPLRTAARRCPDATFLPSDPAAYDAASEQVMGLLRDLGHPVEVWGWDEAYVGAWRRRSQSNVAEQIRSRHLGGDRAVLLGRHQRQQTARQGRHRLRETGRRSSTLTDANWMTVMADRPVDALWGVGPKTAKKLAALDITTVGELAAQRCRAADVDVRPAHRPVAAAAGQGGRRHGRQRRAVGSALPQPRRHLSARPHRPRRNGLGGNANWPRKHSTTWWRRARIVTRVAVTVRTATFYTRTKIRKLAAPSTDADVITAAALRVLDLFELDRPIRLLGVRLELEMPK